MHHFPSVDACGELLLDRVQSEIAHRPPEGLAQEGALVDQGIALDTPVPRKAQRGLA